MASPPARAQTDGRWPSVSVVVVNYDGLDYIDRCLGSLRELSYPAEQVEVIVVDNGSTDGSVEHLRQHYPEVRLIANETNTGFAPAVNQGAEAASGTYLALINNDAEADRSWLRAAIHELETEPTIACVASKILRSDRVTIDYAGGQMAFYGHGFAKDVHHPDRHDDVNRDTLFASGGAMIVRRRTFLDTGGFDASYFAFFEDVDFGWRLNLLGHRVRYVPASVVYHRHHGTIERFGDAREAYLLERNALATIFKNYGDEQLARVLPTSVLLSVFRGVDVEGTELPDYRITEGAKPLETMTISARTGAHLAALRDFALMLDDLVDKRTVIQARRRVDDRAVMKLFETSLQPNIYEPAFLEAYDKLLRAFELRDHARPRSRVLALTTEHIGEHMTAAGARAWEIARLLAHEHEVVLASTRPPERSEPSFQTLLAEPSLIDQHLPAVDVVIAHGRVLDQFPQVEAADVPLVLDLADPVHLANLNRPGGDAAVEALNRQLRRADFVVCASGKQRDFWLGQLAGLGRVNPATFDQDSSLRSLVAVAPTGVPEQPPQRQGPGLKGEVEGIGPDDFLLLWGGEVEEDLDPSTVVRAMAALAGDHPDIKLYLPEGTAPATAAAKRLAEELGLLGGTVHFGPAAPYDRRADHLLDADAGIWAHRGAVREAFSFRARFLDYLWAGLPVIATEGDSLTEPLREHGAGLLVPPGDVEGLAEAIVALRGDTELRASLSKAAAGLGESLAWARALAPLTDFVRQPRRAPDRVGRAARYVARSSTVVVKPPTYYLSRLVEHLRTVGVRGTLRHARSFLGRVLRSAA